MSHRTYPPKTHGDYCDLVSYWYGNTVIPEEWDVKMHPSWHIKELVKKPEPSPPKSAFERGISNFYLRIQNV